MTTPTDEPAARSERDERKAERAVALVVLAAFFGLITLGIGVLIFCTLVLGFGGQYGGLPVLLFGLPLMILSGLLSAILGLIYLSSDFKSKTGTGFGVATLIGLVLSMVLVAIPFGISHSQQSAQLAGQGDVIEHKVTFEVTGPRSAEIIYDWGGSYAAEGKDDLRSVSLPWRITKTVHAYQHYDEVNSSVSIVGRQKEYSQDIFTCRILVDGKVVAEDSDTANGIDGPYCNTLSGYQGDDSGAPGATH